MIRRGTTALLALLLTMAWLAPTANAGDRDPQRDHPRVIGGQQSAPGQWPWQVAILDAHTSDTYAAFFCGGTVISRSWVLTAAHCVTEGGRPSSPSDIQVLTGTNVLGDASGHRNRVAAVHPISTWNPGSNQNDVALLRLAKPTSAPPITLVTPAQSSLWGAGIEATVSGWGNMSADPAHSSYPTHLRHGTVPVQTDATCGAKYPSSRGADLTFHVASMLCAGPLGGGRDTCNGDSGGPLMVPGPGGAGWLQAGITSWGFGCALANNPGVYSRLGATAMANFVSSTKRFGPFDSTVPFIVRQYVDFTGRFPTAAQIATWQTRLRSSPPRDLVSALESSPTWQDHGWAVTRLFGATFLRDPDTSGLSYWIGRTFAGVPLASVASSFAGSREFTNRYGHLGNGGFVDLVYRNVLGRAADPSGRAYWIRQLSSGVTRGSMMARFSESHEYRASSFARVRAITTWYALLRVAPSTSQIPVLQSEPIATLIDSVRLSFSYAMRF